MPSAPLVKDKPARSGCLDINIMSKMLIVQVSLHICKLCSHGLKGKNDLKFFRSSFFP